MIAHEMNGDREKFPAGGPHDGLTKPTQPAPVESGSERRDPNPERAGAATGFDSDDLIGRMMGNENLARRVAGRFLEDMPRQLLALSQALGSADAESARRHAHSIKGAAANISVEPVRELAARLEDLGKDGRLADASELMPELSSTFEAVAPVMRRFCTP